MNETIAILGRQPALGLAELESLYGGGNARPIGDGNVAYLRISPCSIDFARLGGTIKLCKVLTTLDTTSWDAVCKFLVSAAPAQADHMPAGKMHLGLSAYGIRVTPSQLLATGLSIKKAIQKHSGRSVRLVPNKTASLNTAQILHNKLTTPNGWELVFVRDGQRTIIAQTVSIQDIERYGQRDHGRPKRDARVGMLPPKLAQIIINLAVGPEEYASAAPKLSGDVCLQSEDEQKLRASRARTTLLDPFCGTGVVLQEALLMGYTARGTDLEPRMITYTETNLQWLKNTYHSTQDASYSIAAGDATAYRWNPAPDVIATETYLGRPFTTPPTAEILAQTVTECNLIIKRFLQNIHPQLRPDTRLCLAVPAWQIRPGQFRHLPLVDHLDSMGYNKIRFEHVRDEQLLYYREEQIVARQLIILKRI